MKPATPKPERPQPEDVTAITEVLRIDDKISRLMRGAAAGEDVERDLLGYLVLLRIARTREL